MPKVVAFIPSRQKGKRRKWKVFVFHFPLSTFPFQRGGLLRRRVKDALDEKYQPIEKLTFSCCRADGLLGSFKQIGKKSIMLVGMETHVCVLQTALDLLVAGYDVFVLVDAICSRRKQDKEIGIQRMRDSGAVLTTTEMVIFELMKVAGTDEFKKILPIVK